MEDRREGDEASANTLNNSFSSNIDLNTADTAEETSTSAIEVVGHSDPPTGNGLRRVRFAETAHHQSPNGSASSNSRETFDSASERDSTDFRTYVSIQQALSTTDSSHSSTSENPESIFSHPLPIPGTVGTSHSSTTETSSSTSSTEESFHYYFGAADILRPIPSRAEAWYPTPNRATTSHPTRSRASTWNNHSSPLPSSFPSPRGSHHTTQFNWNGSDFDREDQELETPAFTEAPPRGIDLENAYDKMARDTDQADIRNWDRDMDMILVFAALFSAILTAFLVDSYENLQPDQEELMVANLQDISSILYRMASNGSHDNPTSLTFSTKSTGEIFLPDSSDVWINGLWFLALSLSLVSAVSAMLVKQWLQQYSAELSSTASTSDASYRDRRQLRYNNLIAWKVPFVINALPLSLHFAVMLFLLGLNILVWNLYKPLGIAVVLFLGSTGFLYMGVTAIPLFDPLCPYKTSFTEAIRGFLCYVLSAFNTLSLWLRGELLVSRSLLSDDLMSRFEMTVAALETSQVRKQKQDLEVDRIIWMAQHSQQTDVVDAALKKIPELQGDCIAKKVVRSGLVENLVQQAHVEVPDYSADLWIPRSKGWLLSVIREMDGKLPYLVSLLFIWLQNDYLTDAHPPPISRHDDLSGAHHLLPGLLKLWHLIKPEYFSRRHDLAIMSIAWGMSHPDSYDLNAFAAVVCAETVYSYLHPSGVTDENYSALQNDLVHLLDPRSHLHDKTVELVLDTLAHSLCRRIETAEQREMMLTGLVRYGDCCIVNFDGGAIWVKIALCLCLMGVHGLSSNNLLQNRKTMLKHWLSSHANTLSNSGWNLWDDLWIFYEGYSGQCAVRNLTLSCPDSEYTLDTVIRWMPTFLFSEKTPFHTGPALHRSFLKLPILPASKVLSAIERMVIDEDPKPISPALLDYLTRYLADWYSDESTSRGNRVHIIDILVSVLLGNWAQDPDAPEHDLAAPHKAFQTVCAFFTAVLRSQKRYTDNGATNYLCRSCAKLLGLFAGHFLKHRDSRSLAGYEGAEQPELVSILTPHGNTGGRGESIKMETVLRLMCKGNVLNACVEFLSSSKCSPRTDDAWNLLWEPWEHTHTMGIQRLDAESRSGILIDYTYQKVYSALSNIRSRFHNDERDPGLVEVIEGSQLPESATIHQLLLASQEGRDIAEQSPLHIAVPTPRNSVRLEDMDSISSEMLTLNFSVSRPSPDISPPAQMFIGRMSENETGSSHSSESDP